MTSSENIDKTAVLGILRLGFGCAPAAFTEAGVELGLFDAMTEEPVHANELATAVKADPDALKRLLRALAFTGVVERVGPDLYAHTPLSRQLRTDVPGDNGYLIRWGMTRVMNEIMRYTAETVRKGSTLFEEVFGKPFYDYLSQDDIEAGNIFNRAMIGNSGRVSSDIVGKLDLAHAQTLVEIGGGRGRLIKEILEENPHLRGVLLDLEYVLDDVLTELRPGGALAPRARLVPGDARKSVDVKGDVYILKNVLHMWDDQTVVDTLRNVAEAAGPNAPIYVIDVVLETGGETDDASSYMDMLMLLIMDAKERSIGEWTSLFDQAGLDIVSQTRLSDGHLTMLEGRAR